MKRHSSKHGTPRFVNLGFRSDWETRSLKYRGIWCDPDHRNKQHIATQFDDALKPLIYDYCCERILAGQRVPKEFDAIALKAYNEVFVYGGCKPLKLVKAA